MGIKVKVTLPKEYQNGELSGKLSTFCIDMYIRILSVLI